MKRSIGFLLILFVVSNASIAQSSPYSGGNGSGYLSLNSPPVICSNFSGGDADGTSVGLSAPTICPPFFGGAADGYSGSQKVGCAIVLASKGISFYGEKESAGNILHWKVTGMDPSLFQVQKSSNGITFTTFGTVAGSANNDITYLFIDNSPFFHVTFYRLRITETNSLVSYSDIIFLRDLSKSGPLIYPNPSQGSSQLYYYSDRNQTTKLNIFQIDGKKIIDRTITLKAGKNNIPLDLKFLPNGLYYIIIGSKGKALKLIVSK